MEIMMVPGEARPYTVDNELNAAYIDRQNSIPSHGNGGGLGSMYGAFAGGGLYNGGMQSPNRIEMMSNYSQSNPLGKAPLSPTNGPINQMAPSDFNQYHAYQLNQQLFLS